MESYLTQGASVTDRPAYWPFPTLAKFASPFRRSGKWTSNPHQISLIKDTHWLYIDNNLIEYSTHDFYHINNLPSPTKHEEDILCWTPPCVSTCWALYSENFVPKSVFDKAPPKQLGQLYVLRKADKEPAKKQPSGDCKAIWYVGRVR